VGPDELDRLIESEHELRLRPAAKTPGRRGRHPGRRHQSCRLLL